MSSKLKNISLLVGFLVITSLAVYFIVYKDTFDIRNKAAGSDEWGDERFGIGGGYYSKLQEYKIRWVYNWGWDVVAGHLFSNGRKNMIMIGDPHYPRDDCGDSFDPANPGCGGYSLISDLAISYPSSYWAIDNEPDWQGYMTPDVYAKWFHTFSTAIKEADPTAKISVGGIAWPRYNHPSKWKMKDLVDDPYIQSLITSDPNNRNIYENAAWVILFRKYYKDYYGEYPKVDFWNIHPYPQKGKNAYERFLDSKESVLFFRDYIEFIGESEKPLWVTEFSWMSGNKCEDFDDCNSKSARQIEYMRSMIDWFASTNYVQKWFWYYGGEEAPWAGSNYTADIFYKDGELNEVGKKYLEYAYQYKDTINPEVGNIFVSKHVSVSENYSINVAVEASDDTGVVEYHYSLGTSEGSDDIISWDFDTVITDSHSISIKGIVDGEYKLYLNLKVRDGSNNESNIKSVKISDGYCESDCTNKQCGDDGCGRSCGSCSGGEICNADGQCESSCTRDCSRRECGSDGCFGSCGFCTNSDICVEGRCECILDCTGRICGEDDGCGGKCIMCDDGYTCNTTTWQCEEDLCVPDCTDKTCGHDGCNGSCGTCSDGSVCFEGSCKEIDYSYDVNIDGKVNMLDLAVISNNWKWKGGSRDEAADINRDGSVNMLDLATVINNWTKKY